jgi:hypothetical protein
MRLRISIRGLIALVLLVGFALAALRGASLGWATASILMALLALCTATLGSLTRSGPRRAPWLGFAVFGWAYFLLHFGPWSQWVSGYGPARFTTWAIDGLILPRLDPELESGIAVAAQEGFITLRSGRGGSFFCAVSHALVSLLFGLTGSLIGSFMGAQHNEVREPE